MELLSSDEPRLQDKTKGVIRDALESLCHNVDGFKKRAAQNGMIGEVSKTLAGEYDGKRIICVEGPTGTGKSIGYMLSAIPVARQEGKKVLLSTATIALQEQLIEKDLPNILRNSGLHFNFRLAKGRSHYFCDRKAGAMVKDNADSHQGTLDLGKEEAVQSSAGEWAIKPMKGEPEMIARMLKARREGSWDGDLDTWPEPIRPELLAEIGGCATNDRYHRSCSFFEARESLKEEDVIVANHSLVVSDIMLGGGIILPDPKDCIYVFDEGHHLSQSAINQGASQTHIVGPLKWLRSLSQAVMRATDNVPTKFDKSLNTIQEATSNLSLSLPGLEDDLQRLNTYLTKNHPSNHRRGKRPKYADDNWLLTPETMPNELLDLFVVAKGHAGETYSSVQKIYRAIGAVINKMDGHQGLEKIQAELGFFSKRLDPMHTAFALMQPWKGEGGQSTPPTARWITWLNKGNEYLVAASPVSAAKLLKEMLWNTAAGAVVTSATLTSLGRFDRLFEQLGLEGTRTLKLPSPFKHKEQATLQILQQGLDPRNHESHTQAIVKHINQGLIDPAEGTLMLFASYRQMRAVAEKLSPELKAILLMQGELSRKDLLSNHRQAIAEGKGSLLFGVASLAEGVDLPGKECAHVLIAKLAFSVPSSPTEKAYADWLTKYGRNPFMEMSVPDASFRLVQAVGRLIRTITDTGRVTILDPRLVQKPYGRKMLAALPEFGEAKAKEAV